MKKDTLAITILGMVIFLILLVACGGGEAPVVEETADTILSILAQHSAKRFSGLIAPLLLASSGSAAAAATSGTEAALVMLCVTTSCGSRPWHPMTSRLPRAPIHTAAQPCPWVRCS